eukprot:jgi/Botrbrau1/18837/Bobra.177_2s0002.1
MCNDCLRVQVGKLYCNHALYVLETLLRPHDHGPPTGRRLSMRCMVRRCSNR